MNDEFTCLTSTASPGCSRVDNERALCAKIRKQLHDALCGIGIVASLAGSFQLVERFLNVDHDERRWRAGIDAMNVDRGT